MLLFPLSALAVPIQYVSTTEGVIGGFTYDGTAIYTGDADEYISDVTININYGVGSYKDAAYVLIDWGNMSIKNDNGGFFGATYSSALTLEPNSTTPNSQWEVYKPNERTVIRKSAGNITAFGIVQVVIELEAVLSTQKFTYSTGWINFQPSIASPPSNTLSEPGSLTLLGLGLAGLGLAGLGFARRKTKA
jgi:hypothetical protein